MTFRTFVSSLTAVSLLLTQLTLPAHAAVVGTQQFIETQDRAGLIATIDATLARDDVRQELVAMGVDPDAALARVAALSDAELEQVAGQLESLPAGGDALALIGAVFLVLLILELTGVINIFSKV